MSSGNPNIIEDTLGKQTGPVSEIGKLKISVNPIKHFKKGSSMNQLGTSRVTKLMESAGIDFSKAGDAIEKRNLFIIWLKGKTTQELTEIARLDGIIEILETDMTMRVMKKLEKGVALTDADVRLIRLLKDCIASVNEMKFGKKNININASYDDIRKLMFGEEKSENTTKSGLK